MDVTRTGLVLRPNNSRVVLRPFEPIDPQRIMKIVARVMALGDAEVQRLLDDVLREFLTRHHRVREFFLARYEQVKGYLLTDAAVSEPRQLLIGSYFTQEYALESAALFNPAMVWHPDQSGLPAGTRRFILSLRATGEGHLSSITFRSGTIDAEGTLAIEEPTPYVTAPDVIPNAQYEKSLFQRKLFELGMGNGFVEKALGPLEDRFTLTDLQESIRQVMRQDRVRQQQWDPVANGVLALAKSNYEIAFSPEQGVSERIIFPYSPTEVNGIEDARFVQFQEEDGRTHYYATYSAFDGKVVFPQLLQTDDFLRFKVSTLNGPEVRNKGMALFPRKVNGLYAMLSRQDGENIYLMYSDMLHFWYTKELIARPTYPWEFVQVGNCGSPIETPAGWLLLSHGVGPVRKYCLGAYLLDLEDPRKVIGRLPRPLLIPNENEREGYVPNVVYSCGGVLHNGQLIIPYAMSDYASTFATISLQTILERMV